MKSPQNQNHRERRDCRAIIQRRWRRFLDSSSRISASLSFSRVFLSCLADCHSRKTSSAAASEYEHKKEQSFRTSPQNRISVLSKAASAPRLNSCSP